MGRGSSATDQPKLRPRFEKGIIRGKTIESDGFLVGLPSGVIVARSVRPLPREEQSSDFLKQIRWTPWMPGGGGFPEEKLRAAADGGEERENEAE